MDENQVLNSRDELVDQFFDWLSANFPGKVILVAHDAFNKQAALLVEHLLASGWNDEQIESNIEGFSDTLVAFPKYFTGNISGRIKPLLLRPKNDYCGASFGRLLRRPQ